VNKDGYISVGILRGDNEHWILLVLRVKWLKKANVGRWKQADT